MSVQFLSPNSSGVIVAIYQQGIQPLPDSSQRTGLAQPRMSYLPEQLPQQLSKVAITVQPGR